MYSNSPRLLGFLYVTCLISKCLLDTAVSHEECSEAWGKECLVCEAFWRWQQGEQLLGDSREAGCGIRQLTSAHISISKTYQNLLENSLERKEMGYIQPSHEQEYPDGSNVDSDSLL